MHPPRNGILKETHYKSHTKSMSHLIWGFCLNKISLALSIPFLFPNLPVQWRLNFYAHRSLNLKWQFNCFVSGQLFSTMTKNKSILEQGLMELNSLHFLWFFFSRVTVLLALVYSHRCVKLQGEELELVMDAILNQSTIRIPLEKAGSSK